MEKTKITVRVERDALAAARRYAQQHDATLTSLVTEFFRSVARSERSDQATPILDELTGSLARRLLWRNIVSTSSESTSAVSEPHAFFSISTFCWMC